MKNRKIKLGICICDIQGTFDSIHSLSYIRWTSMLDRCYSDKLHKRNPWYIGCTVCDEWKLYSNFKKWFDKHYVDGYQLDKDILIDGNKVYSPETCCFVPQYINVLLLNSRNGITYNKKDKRYQAQLRIYGKNTYIGQYINEIDARNAYIETKRIHTRKLAIDAYMNNEIDERIMNAIIKKAYNLK